MYVKPEWVVRSWRLLQSLNSIANVLGFPLRERRVVRHKVIADLGSGLSGCRHSSIYTGLQVKWLPVHRQVASAHLAKNITLDEVYGYLFPAILAVGSEQRVKIHFTQTR